MSRYTGTTAATGDSATLNNSPNTTPKLKEVFFLLKSIKQRWYELFLNLGIHRHVLEECLKDHPFDDHSALLQVIALWLQKTDPLPSWKELVDVIENILLEGKIAVEIKRMYCCELLMENEDNGDTPNIQDESQPYIDHENMAFTTLLSTVTEKLGPSSVPELQHFLLNLRCPDGSLFLRSECIYDRKTVDGLIIPLVAANLCTPRDLDILIYILNGLKRQDLLSLISAYVPKVTVGRPFVRPPNNCDENCIIQVVLNEALKQTDLGIISAIKHDLCTCFKMQQRPFLMQYIGWQKAPVTLHFQVPTACMQLVEDGLHNTISQLSGNGIDYIKVINNSNVVLFLTVP